MNPDSIPVRAHLVSTTLWSAPAERSGDGALAPYPLLPEAKAVSRFTCHRTPYKRGPRWLVVPARGALPAPWHQHSRRRAFSLIEMIGVLAIIAVLAAVLLPALIRQMDKAAADQETATLQSFGAAIQNNGLRTRVIPDDVTLGTNWISVITNELGMSTSLVSINPRNRARVFVIDTNGFSPIVLPYTQTSAGVGTLPFPPRFMIVSSLGAALPSGLISRPGQTVFNDLWNTAPGAIPANPIWSGWNNGRADDLIVQRINLSPSFVHLILTINNSTLNYASYRIDSGPTITNVCNAYFLQNSVLNLYSNAVLDSQQILQRDTSFVYDQNVWRSSITSVSVTSTNAVDFSGIVNAFVNAGPLNANPPPSTIANDFINYMTAYNTWAGNNFPPAGKAAVVNVYNTMMNDVNTLVQYIQPQ